MGEANSSALGFEFNGAVKAEGAPNHLTGDAGVLVIRELDDRLGLTSGLALQVADPRNPAFVIHPMVELLRSRLYAMAQSGGNAHGLARLCSRGVGRIHTKGRESVQMMMVNAVGRDGPGKGAAS